MIKYESQRRAVAKYNKEAYDTIQLRVPKGDRDGIKAFAERRGETLNGFITGLIKEAMLSEKSSPYGDSSAKESENS